MRGFWLFIIAWAAIVVTILIVNMPDYGRCLISHRAMVEESYQAGSVPVSSGGMTMQIPIYASHTVEREICDRWEFPNGRPRAH